MKFKSLLLGSIAAAGLVTGASAADLQKGVMTSLDVCDALGLSGLTISSDKDCLQLSGSVSYMFAWGDYATGAGSDNSGQRIVATPDDNSAIAIKGSASGTGSGATDWDTQMIAWLQAVGSSDSDFGVAKAVIKIRSEQYRHSYNGYGYYDGDDTGGSTVNHGNSALGEQGTSDGNSATSQSNSASGTVLFDQAYVSVGDSTVLTAGKTGTIINTGDDTPLNWLGLFNASNTASGGVLWSVENWAGGNNLYGGSVAPGDTAGADIQTGGAAIQLQSTLGNGIKVGAALEDLQDTNVGRAGTAVGVISYAGDNLTAHLSLIEAGVLDGHPDVTAYHAGFTGTFDKFKLTGAIAGDSSGYWDGLASAQATFDMFKLAASVEGGQYGSGAVTNSYTVGAGNPGANSTVIESRGGDTFFGYGGSATVTVSDGVSLNVGGRYFDSDTSTANNEGYQAAVALVAAVTETLTLEGDLGIYGTDNGGIYTQTIGAGTTAPVTQVGTLNAPGTWSSTYYGAASVTWAPGGGFTSSLKGEIYSDGAYKATFNASKAFQ